MITQTSAAQHAIGNVDLGEARRFLARAVPWGVDYIGIHRAEGDAGWKRSKRLPRWKGKPVKSLDAAIAHVSWQMANGAPADFYACMGAQRECAERAGQDGKTFKVANKEAENITRLKSFFIDIDAGEEAYSDKPDRAYKSTDEALAALDQFVTACHLPEPTIVVGSGNGGLHVHWTLSEAVSADEWQVYADALVEAADQHGLLCDAGCTSDRSRVLRIPGTFNLKYGNRAVKILRDREIDLPLERMAEALTPYVSTSGPKRSTIRLAAKDGCRIDDNFSALGDPARALKFAGAEIDELGSGVARQKGAGLRRFEDLRRECAFVEAAFVTGGAAFSNPLWNQTTLLAAFTVEGRDAAHWMGDQHAGYSIETTDELFERKQREIEQRGVGWPRCDAIKKEGSKFCDQCPHFAEGKSPLNFAAAILEKADGGDTVILTAKEIHKNTVATYEAVKSHVPLFEHNRKLVTIGETELRPPEQLPGQKEAAPRARTASFVAVSENMLQANLSKHLTFKIHDKEGKLVKADAPSQVSRMLVAAPRVYDVPQVERLVGSPFLQANGEIITSKGYHPPTKAFLYGNLDLSGLVPASPKRADALWALKLFSGLLQEFPFKDEASQSAAMSMILTLLVRNLMTVAPMHAVTAAAPGSGKGELCAIATRISHGCEFPAMGAGKTEEELQKRLESALLGGYPIVGLDNVTTTLQGDVLCQAITQPSLDIRPLGKSEKISVVNCSAIIANGNNLILADDMVRRSILVSLDANMERPELREFKIPASRIKNGLYKNRTKWVAFGLTIVRAFILAVSRGEAKMLQPFNGFEGWSAYVRSPIVWLGYPDPLLTQERIQQNDPERARRSRIFAAWAALTGGQPMTIKDAIESAWRPATNSWATDAPNYPTIQTLIEDVPRRPGSKPDVDAVKRALGSYFSKTADYVADGLKLYNCGVSHKVTLWRVGPPPTAGG